MSSSSFHSSRLVDSMPCHNPRRTVSHYRMGASDLTAHRAFRCTVQLPLRRDRGWRIAGSPVSGRAAFAHLFGDLPEPRSTHRFWWKALRAWRRKRRTSDKPTLSRRECRMCASMTMSGSISGNPSHHERGSKRPSNAASSSWTANRRTQAHGCNPDRKSSCCSARRRPGRSFI